MPHANALGNDVQCIYLVDSAGEVQTEVAGLQEPVVSVVLPPLLLEVGQLERRGEGEGEEGGGRGKIRERERKEGDREK